MTIRLEKPVRRLVDVRGRGDYVVTITRAGVELRQPRRRFTVTLPWSDILGRAERLAGEAVRREQLRDAAVQRMLSGRGSR